MHNAQFTMHNEYSRRLLLVPGGLCLSNCALCIGFPHTHGQNGGVSMRRVILICLAFAVLLCACGREEWQNLRQFCENFSRFASETGNLANVEPGQFFACRADDGIAYQTYLGDSLLLECGALRSGRIHSVSLTGLPEQGQSAFFDAARCVVQACTDAAPDQAERWLRQIQAGESEVLGMLGFEEGGFRFSYAANGAGRWLQVSQLRFLPPEPELPTLREMITED